MTNITAFLYCQRAIEVTQEGEEKSSESLLSVKDSQFQTLFARQRFANFDTNNVRNFQYVP